MSVPTATTSRMAFDANNPDHLAALISGLEEEDRKLHRKIGLETRDKKGEILDSLAHLAVCRNSGQILAIGAVTVDKAIELVVADNGPVEQEVRSFLKSFLTSLSDIRTHIKSSSINASKLPEGSPPSLSAELKRIGDHQLEEELYTLKISAILHNLPKIRKRFNKHIIHFQAFRTSFVGHADDQPEAMIILVNKLNTLLDALAEALLTLTSSHNDADALEIVLLATKSANKYCVRNLEELNRCTEYIENTPWLLKFDVHHWVSKIASTHVHLNRVTRLAISRSMEDFLSPTIKYLDNDTVSSSFSISRKAFVDLLKSIPWTPHEDEGLDEDKLFDAMCASFTRTHPPTVDETPLDRGMRVYCFDDEIQFDLKIAVHAECIVLEHLMARQGAMPYIGVSKLSCTPCHLYFSLYPGPFRTMGTHSLFPPTWMCPTNVQEMRLKLCKLLLPKLELRARRLESREKYKRRSQSTDASNDSDALSPDDSPDSDDEHFQQWLLKNRERTASKKAYRLETGEEGAQESIKGRATSGNRYTGSVKCLSSELEQCSVVTSCLPRGAYVDALGCLKTLSDSAGSIIQQQETLLHISGPVMVFDREVVI